MATATLLLPEQEKTQLVTLVIQYHVIIITTITDAAVRMQNNIAKVRS
jgi:hypothetical protein